MWDVKIVSDTDSRQSAFCGLEEPADSRKWIEAAVCGSWMPGAISYNGVAALWVLDLTPGPHELPGPAVRDDLSWPLPGPKLYWLMEVLELKSRNGHRVAATIAGLISDSCFQRPPPSCLHCPQTPCFGPSPFIKCSVGAVLESRTRTLGSRSWPGHTWGMELRATMAGNKPRTQGESKKLCKNSL